MAIDVRDAINTMASIASAGQKQVRFATRVALTKTAQKAQAAEVREMHDVFKSPTPFTTSSVFVQPATATRLEATVRLKDAAMKAVPASKYLAPQIDGGQRSLKRFEKALTSIGVMPVGYRAVPGKGARLDGYGNMSRGQIVQILAFFRAFPEMGYKANMTDKSKARLARGSKRAQGFAYFVGTPGDRLPLGIYQRVSFARGTALKSVLLFVRSAVYEPRFDFEYVVKKTVETEFGGEFATAFIDAQRTAR